MPGSLKDPELVRLDVDQKISDNLKMGFFTLRAEERDAALLYLVQHRIKVLGLLLTSTSTKVQILTQEVLPGGGGNHHICRYQAPRRIRLRPHHRGVYMCGVCAQRACCMGR